MFGQIDVKKQQLDTKRPLPKYTVQAYEKSCF